MYSRTSASLPRLAALLAAFGFGAVASLPAQSTGSTTGASGQPGLTLPPGDTFRPPFIAGPPPSANVSPTLRQALDAAHTAWKSNDGGAAFSPGLGYDGNGKPILMLMANAAESPTTKSARRRAIVTALGFLLDAGAADHATICVSVTDRRTGTTITTKNYAIDRTQFEQTAKGAAGMATIGDALTQARAKDAVVQGICGGLGID